MNNQVIANFENWIQRLDSRIIQLDRYGKMYKIVNLIIVVNLAITTTALGYLESISLGVEVTDGTSDKRIAFSAVKLALIIIGTILTTLVSAINPSKKAGDCFKSAKDYSELSMQISAKRDKFSLGIYGDDQETLKVYSTFCNTISAREKVIMDEQSVFTRTIIK